MHRYGDFFLKKIKIKLRFKRNFYWTNKGNIRRCKFTNVSNFHFHPVAELEHLIWGAVRGAEDIEKLQIKGSKYV